MYTTTIQCREVFNEKNSFLDLLEMDTHYTEPIHNETENIPVLNMEIRNKQNEDDNIMIVFDRQQANILKTIIENFLLNEPKH